MSDQTLKVSIAALARYNSNDWKRFLDEYRAYVDKVTQELVTSPVETLPLAQGRARHAGEFLRILEDAPKTADALDKQKGK